MNDTMTNRQWLLVARPDGKLKQSDFEYREQPFTVPDLDDGQFVLRNRIFVCGPVMRNFMNAPGPRTRVSIPLGLPVIGPVGSEVIASRNPDYPVGTLVETTARWEDYSVITPNKGSSLSRATGDMTLMDLMGPLSRNTMTAYFGLFEVGLPKPGETVVVSGAAGSVGMKVCQFAKGHGCRVIGIAGGRAKCDWLVDELGIDAAIDYKSEDVAERLKALCPDGVNVYFDNVGGDTTQAVIDNIAPHGRIAVCGQVSSYNGDAPPPGPRDMMKIVFSRVRIEGFTIADWTPRMEEGRLEVQKWVRDGRLVSREDVREGFETLPATFLELFEGTNNGSLLVKA